MQQGFSPRWTEAYRQVIDELPHTAAVAAMTLCGMNTVVDARVEMTDLADLPGSDDQRARAFVMLLRDRALKGIGGEVRVDWLEGPAWLKKHLPIRYDLGGTGPHAARALNAVGAPALVALQDRSPHMLSLFPPQVMIAEGGMIVAARDARQHGEPRPETFIFEYSAGSQIDGSVLSRSSRIVVRFDDGGVDIDPAFDALTPSLASIAGAGLISGFNNEPLDRLEAAIERIFGLTRVWKKAGLPLIHLELAGYASREALDLVLQAVPGAVTSVGISQSELLALMGDSGQLTSVISSLGEMLGVERLCVHADHWAVTATKGDPRLELNALITGCLLATTRAAAGAPAMPSQIPAGASFQDTPLPELYRAEFLDICVLPVAVPGTPVNDPWPRRHLYRRMFACTWATYFGRLWESTTQLLGRIET